MTESTKKLGEALKHSVSQNETLQLSIGNAPNDIQPSVFYDPFLSTMKKANIFFQIERMT